MGAPFKTPATAADVKHTISPIASNAPKQKLFDFPFIMNSFLTKYCLFPNNLKDITIGDTLCQLFVYFAIEEKKGQIDKAERGSLD
jgi:hypothetical protein